MSEPRPLTPTDRPAAHALLESRWGSAEVARLGVLVDASEAQGFCTEGSAGLTGLVTYAVVAEDCEVLTLDSLAPGQGLGSALLESVIAQARLQGCRRVWLVTTNDNLHALGFYQRRGFQLIAVHPGAVDRSRAELKPSIPRIADNGLPIRDELVLERGVTWLDRAQ